MGKNRNELFQILAVFLLLFGCVSCSTSASSGLPQNNTKKDVTKTSIEYFSLPTKIIPTLTSVWDQYKPSTIELIISEFNEEVESLPIGSQSIYPYPSYKVKMIYLDECRDLTPGRIEILTLYSNAFTSELTDTLVKIHQQECLFSEGNEEYWLPIQEQLIPYLQKEANKGDEVTLYIRWIGVNKITSEIDWVFWIAEFNT